MSPDALDCIAATRRLESLAGRIRDAIERRRHEGVAELVAEARNVLVPLVLYVERPPRECASCGCELHSELFPSRGDGDFCSDTCRSTQE